MTPEQILLKKTADYFRAHPQRWVRGGGGAKWVGDNCGCVTYIMNHIIDRQYGTPLTFNAQMHIVTTLDLPRPGRQNLVREFQDAVWQWNDKTAKDVYEIITGLDIAAAMPFVFDADVHMTERA